jgi:hypothetical protein
VCSRFFAGISLILPGTSAVEEDDVGDVDEKDEDMEPPAEEMVNFRRFSCDALAGAALNIYTRNFKLYIKVSRLKVNCKYCLSLI